MTYDIGFKFFTQSSPLHPLEIFDKNADKFSIRRVDLGLPDPYAGLWDILTAWELDLEAFQHPPEGRVLVIPGNIACSSMMILNGVVYDLCYLSDEKGVVVKVAPFHGLSLPPEMKRTPAEGDATRIAQIGNRYHRTIFRGRSCADDYVRIPAYIWTEGPCTT